MNGSSLRSMFDGSTRESDLVLGSSTKVLNIMRTQLPAVADFVNTTFEEFALLNQEEKWTVFRSFITTLWMMDSFYRTCRLVPPDLFSTVMLKECLKDGERISTLTVMQNLEITETEYAALLALALWSPSESFGQKIHSSLSC
ncbi:hypothetical protein OSTOST_12756, partial [Ostertagia ostertagi]